MGRPLKIAKRDNAGFNWVDIYNIGVVGGNTDLDGSQILVRVKIGANSEADGYIVRQKGSKKFLVSDGTNVGQCVLVNKANGALAAGEMSISVLKEDSTVLRLARISNKYGIDFSGNRFALSFTDAVDDTAIKSGTAQQTIDVVIVENDTSWSE